MPVTMKPTSPASSRGIGCRLGVMTPISSTVMRTLLCRPMISSPALSEPSTTRTNAITPRYWS